jgi:hypothetical protein
MKTLSNVMSTASAVITSLALCSAPANADLLANWRLDEASGPAVNDANSAFNGTINSATQNQPGKIGTAYSFSGGSHANVNPGGAGAPAAPAPSPTGTVSAWVNPTAGAWTGNIVYLQNPTFIQFRLEADNKLTYRQDGGRDRVINTGAGAVPDGVWTHVVAVVDPGSIKLYINGSLSITGLGSNGYVTNNSTFLQIGAGAGQNFEGSIDDVAVWNTALSAGKVGTLGSILAANGGALSDYNAFQMDKLFTVHDTGTPAAVSSTAGTLTWTKFTGGSGTAGSVTYDVPSQTYMAFFDATSGVTAVASGSSAPLQLAVTQNGANLEFTWNSQTGKLYDLLSATDLTTAPATWGVWNGNADINASFLTIPRPGDPKRFFALREKDGP